MSAAVADGTVEGAVWGAVWGAVEGAVWSSIPAVASGGSSVELVDVRVEQCGAVWSRLPTRPPNHPPTHPDPPTYTPTHLYLHTHPPLKYLILDCLLPMSAERRWSAGGVSTEGSVAYRP